METDKSLRIAKSVADGIDPVSGQQMDSLSMPKDQIPTDDRLQSSQSQAMEKIDLETAIAEAIEIIRSFAMNKGSPEDRELLANPIRPELEVIVELLRAACTVLMSEIERARTNTETTTVLMHNYPPLESIPPRVGKSLTQFLDEIEKREILRTLEETRFNRTAAAQRLGITFRSMRYRLERLGIE